ncbi:hypothetical protein [Thermocoleostomius sinensis]|uniref:Proton extrusion protein PcxA n=1 Tax=Thermocoleostomius sinensis A174 TaxID=2016057 RepID=A0A9E8ZK25_9CYAN|nr:hypothetical protein [Thermocoleostomius sinensis]WAL59936.1 hypothetical protein OXH18_22640 [Thermocoleostomius sinensis A174]
MLADVNKLNFNRWLNQRQLHALKEAYHAAKEIRALEEHYFAGEKIAYTPQQSKTVVDYVKSLRDRQLTRVRINLVKFRVGAFLFNHKLLSKTSDSSFSNGNEPLVQTWEHPSLVEMDILEKLQFIESVVGKYRDRSPANPDLTSEDLNSELSITHALQHLNSDAGNQKNGSNPDITTDPVVLDANRSRSSANRSNTASALVKGFTQVGKELTPEYEQQVIHELRLRRKQNKLAVRWLLILILVPIAVQVVAKNLIFEPFLDNYGNHHPQQIELNQEIQKEFHAEFMDFKETLEIEQLLGNLPQLTTEETKKRLEEKATELWHESREHALNGLKNVAADVVALIVFIGLIFFNRDKLITIRNFSNWSFLNLSDPAKVFLLILVTDMFVGFHSVEGWDVILVSVFNHFGLPENDTFIKSFIATVPVFMDSCIKFWIFNYLTRFSPSASAVYERMNT